LDQTVQTVDKIAVCGEPVALRQEIVRLRVKNELKRSKTIERKKPGIGG